MRITFLLYCGNSWSFFSNSTCLIWLLVCSRKAFPNGLQDLRAGLENVDVKSSQRIDNLRDEEVIEDRDDSNKNSIAAESVGNEASGTNAQSLKQSDENGSGMICLSDSSIGPQIMDMLLWYRIEYRSNSSGNIIEVCHHRKKMTSVADRNINTDASGVKVKLIHLFSK